MNVSHPGRRTAVAITIAAILVLSTAMIISHSSAGGTQGIGINASRADDLGERAEERNELRADYRGRAAQQRILERTGEAANEPITYIDDKGPWEGEQVFGGVANKGNDWEPAIAADPNSQAAYVLTTRFNHLCAQCGYSAIMLSISDDGGSTWGDPTYLCKACYRWEYDPQISVDDNGTVHATMLVKGWMTVYMKSVDGGATWTTPVDTKIPLSWSDHGFMTVSPDGMDIYVAMNKVDSYIASSHDGGVTWNEPVQTNPDSQNLYYYSYSGAAENGGMNAYISLAAVRANPYATGNVKYFVASTTDGGVTWTQTLLATTGQQPNCKEYDPTCRKDHYAGMAALARDDVGTMVFSYAGATGGPRRGVGQAIWTRRSTDNGATWEPPVLVSPRQIHRRFVIASFTTLAATGNGDFRVAWQDDRNGLQRWNTWTRRSKDGGANYGAAGRLSDAKSGAGYKHPAGYGADYGDYMEIDINSDGKTLAAWGEAYSYWGPGGTWMNVGA